MLLKVMPIPILKDNYVWAIINIQNKSALVVDPGDALPVINYLTIHELQLNGILITHHHFDHTNGVIDLVSEYSVPVFGYEKSEFSLLTHKVSEINPLEINDRFPLFQILAIPGHTVDHIAYYFPNQLFCGDTLFAAGCGKLFEGTAYQLYTSLQKIFFLPDNTLIYCAHEYTLKNLHFAEIVEPGNVNIQKRIGQVKQCYEKNMPSLPTVLQQEKDTNPFLRCHVKEIIHHVQNYCGFELSSPVEVFQELRKWKDHF